MTPARRLPWRLATIATLSVGASCLALTPSGAHAAGPTPSQGGTCSTLSLLCLPITLTPVVEPVTLSSPATSTDPAVLTVGGVSVNLDATIDLASLATAESALEVVNAIDASVDAQASGVSLDAFGLGAYAVDDFRVSAGTVYQQDALLGPDTMVTDLLRLSAQSSLEGLAGANVGEAVDVDAVEYATAGVDLSKDNTTDLLEGTGLATTSEDTLRLSAASDVYNLAHLGLGETDTYVAEGAHLSAQAANDLLAELAHDDALAHVADDTRLSAAVDVDTIASTTDAAGDYEELLGDLDLDAEARNDVLADVAAGPEASTEVVDDLDAVVVATPESTVSPVVATISTALRILLGGW